MAAKMAAGRALIMQNQDKLALPATQLWKWKNISMPGKVFFVMFMILFVVELIVEAYIYFNNMESFTASGMVLGFWIRYILGAIFAVIAFGLYMIVIHVLYYTGFKVFAWFMIFVPLLYFVGTMISARFVASLLSTAKGEGTKSWLTNMFVKKDAAPAS